MRDATAVLIVRSNYVFHANAGYFAPDAKQNILLHMWSLSLESQFYLFADKPCCMGRNGDDW